MYKKNLILTITSIIITIIVIETGLRIIGFNKYKFKGYPPYYLTRVGDYDNFDIKEGIKEIKKAFPTLQLDVRNKKTYNQYKAWNGKHRIF